MKKSFEGNYISKSLEIKARKIAKNKRQRERKQARADKHFANNLYLLDSDYCEEALN